MARAKSLGVWMDRRHVADLQQSSWPRIRCRYSEVALELWPQNSPVISCSLPLGRRPLDALAFCKGLLPEGQALQALADRAGVATNDTFALLARYGRDVAGALIISEAEPDERTFGVERLDDAALAAAVDDLEQHPLGAHDDSELSLAGLQDKLLLVRFDDGRWGRPLRGRPSTHILKRDPGRFPGLVAAEAECLVVARAAGLTSIESEIAKIGDERCLIVSRFDREGTGRVHQEDLCQALAIDPDANGRRAKYESGGGPTLRDLAGLLDVYAADAAAELDRLLAAATYTVLIGNADAHGKNWALLHPDGTHIELAPLYDTVPTVLWPKLRTDGAMSIGGRRSLPSVTTDDLVREATSWARPRERARHVIDETIERCVEATRALENGSAVAAYIQRRAEELRA